MTALRGDEHDADHPAALLLELAERVEVQDHVVDRHRDELLHLEPEGVAQLLLGQPRQADLAHDDPLVAHAHHDLLGLEPADGPELAQGLGDGLGLADLAVLDGALGHLHLGGTQHGDLIAAHGDLGRPDGGGTDVESDPYLRHPLVLPHMHGAVR